MVKTTYLGKSYKKHIIKKKKPSTAVKTGETSALRVYAWGAKNVIVPKKGWKLKRE